MGGGGCTQVSAVRYSDCGDFLFSGSYDRSSKVRVYTQYTGTHMGPYSRLGHIWDTYSILGHMLFLALMIVAPRSVSTHTVYWDTYSRLGHIRDTYSIFGHILFLALMIVAPRSVSSVEIGV